jgi:shikimate kinase
MNIVLIGMPGAGKSALGILLAKALGMEYVDTDIIVQKTEKRLLQDIIDNDGINAFLDFEERVISGLSFENCVVATGGSVIYSEKLMGILKQKSRIIYLHVCYEEIEKRINNITTRGIAMRKEDSLKGIYDERVPMYLKYSDKTIDCSNMDIERCVDEIIKSIG